VALGIIEKVPEGHDKHSPSEMAPIIGPYFPSGQDWHESKELAPSIPEKVPAGHLTQLLMLVLPSNVEKVPKGQGRPLDIPGESQKLPTGQGKQCSFATVASVVENVPTGHFVQFNGDMLPLCEL